MRPASPPRARATTLRRPPGGFALPLGLLLLVVITLLAVSAMRTANLHVLMAGNSQQQVQAQLRAENALAEGQNDVIFDFASLLAAQGAGYYRFDVDGAHPEFDSDAFWENEGNTFELDDHSRYVVEFLANRPAPGESLAVGAGPRAPAPTRNIFRVVARGESDRGAVRIVESYVVTEQAPN